MNLYYEPTEINPDDLILMDINLPGIDGLEVTRQLRQSAIKTTPIIALTANAMRGDREKMIESGCSEYLQKPVSSSTLIEMVERFIGNAELSTAPAFPAAEAVAVKPMTTVTMATSSPAATA